MSRRVTAEDFMRIQVVSDPQIAPDGSRIACVKTHTDIEKSQVRSEIWMVPTLEGEPRRFTGGDWSDSSPRWSPDGTQIAFLSSRKKPDSQIYLIAADGGEARPLTKHTVEGGIQGIRWSPDGTQIAYLFRETPEAYRKTTVEERQKKELPSPPRVHKRLQYRLDGFGYWDDSYFQVWVVDVATGTSRQVTTGDCHCGAPVWSPDGQMLAFLSDRRDDWDIAPPNMDIWTLPIEGGEPTRLPSPPGPKDGLTWSPDGRTFAYAGNPDPTDYWGTNNEHLYLLPATGGEEVVDLTGPADQSVGYLTLSDVHEVGAGDPIRWTSDSQHLYFVSSVNGDTRLYLIDTSGRQTPVALTQRKSEMGGFSVASDDRTLAITLSFPTAPNEVYSNVLAEDFSGLMEGIWSERTGFNWDLLYELELGTPESVEIPNGEGGGVPGWLLKPVDFDEEKRYPLVLYVHGGPHAQYGNTFFHELQFLAGQGYIVLYTNPRGSKGYGEAHTKAILGDWGHADYRDLMAAVDYAVALPYVDEARTAMMGGSYGGYSTAWAVGHTDRFACAIADRLVGNLQSMAGTCDFPWPENAYFKGNAWSDPSDLWRCSPQAFAGNINTPLLIIHSDGDLRCPQGQAEELFAALRLQRKTVEYVRYPAETSHGMSRNGPPSLRLDRLQRNLAWLDKYLKP